MDISLSPFQDQDLPSIIEIEKASFSTPWPEELFLESRKDLWTAKLEGKVVGYIGYEKIADEAHITHMAVHPYHRRRGIGRQLMEKALSTDLNKAFLEVREDNLSARKLYEGLGFKPIGTRKKYYPDGEDAIVMRLEK